MQFDLLQSTKCDFFVAISTLHIHLTYLRTHTHKGEYKGYSYLRYKQIKAKGLNDMYGCENLRCFISILFCFEFEGELYYIGNIIQKNKDYHLYFLMDNCHLGEYFDADSIAFYSDIESFLCLCVLLNDIQFSHRSFSH